MELTDSFFALFLRHCQRRFALSAHPLPPHLPSPFRTTLRSLLTTELDISSVPKIGVFEWLFGFASHSISKQGESNGESGGGDDNEIGEKDMRDKLREFASPEGQVSLRFLSVL